MSLLAPVVTTVWCAVMQTGTLCWVAFTLCMVYMWGSIGALKPTACSSVKVCICMHLCGLVLLGSSYIHGCKRFWSLANVHVCVHVLKGTAGLELLWQLDC